MKPITVIVTVDAPVSKVWQYWNDPEHIQKWAFASDDWECPHAENDLKTGGTFKTTMAAKDKSFSFDLVGTYTNVIPEESIAYTIEGGRTVKISFEDVEGKTRVTETFDPENENPEEMQRQGWQAILDNFKKHVENN